MISCTDLNGSVGETASRRCPCVASAIGWKSRSMAYASLAPRWRVMASAPIGPMQIVYPSGSAFAVRSRPSVSAPPGRLSTTTCCPISLPSSAPRMRATVSVALPAACGTMSRTGRSGYSAAAGVDSPSAATAQASTNGTKRRPRMPRPMLTPPIRTARRVEGKSQCSRRTADVHDLDVDRPRLAPALYGQACGLADTVALELLGEIREAMHGLPVHRNDDVAEGAGIEID